MQEHNQSAEAQKRQCLWNA